MMATRCNIGILEKSNRTGFNQIRYIYSHWDGYPSGVGATLKNHYTDIDKINKLISGGSISSLGKDVDIPEGVNHSFDNPDPSITVFYERDRGETSVEFSVAEIREDESPKVIKENDYLYIWDTENSEWLTF